MLEEVRAVPIYEYKCARCGEVFEAFQKITDRPLTKCKFCQGKVEQLISHTSFQLKGSGWYLTDYSRKSRPSDSPGSTVATESSKGGEKSGAGSGEKASSTTSKPSKSDP